MRGGGLRINGGVSHRQVVQSSVLVGSASVIRHLQDAAEEFVSGRSELIRGLLRDVVWNWDRVEQRVAVEGIDLIEGNEGDNDPACLRRADRPQEADDRVEVHRRGPSPDGLDQEWQVTGIAGLQ